MQRKKNRFYMKKMSVLEAPKVQFKNLVTKEEMGLMDKRRVAKNQDQIQISMPDHSEELTPWGKRIYSLRV